MKLASELQRVSTGNTFYVLDEPTTGLHTDDIARLLEVLNRLVEVIGRFLILAKFVPPVPLISMAAT